MAKLLGDSAMVDLFSFLSFQFDHSHLLALAAVLQRDAASVEMTQAACGDEGAAMAVTMHLEERMAGQDGLEQAMCLGITQVEVLAQLLLADHDVGAAGRVALQCQTERHKAPLQWPGLGLLQQSDRDVDIRHRLYLELVIAALSSHQLTVFSLQR